MFTKLTLGHFKCFKSQNLHLAPLTLLAGANATGKSSILQALALLHQTTTECEWDKSILLNGDTISLGTAKDIIDKVTGRKELYIGLCSDNFECRWTMEVSDKFVLNIPLKEILWREKNEWKEEKFEIVDDVPIRRLIPLSLFNRSQNCRDLASLLHNLNYISADRLGPRETYSASWSTQYFNVGAKGERTAWALYYFADSQPPKQLILQDIQPTLLRQTEAWMRKFFPGTSIEVNPVDRTNLVTLGIRNSDSTDFHRPQNVGYGLTYVLPIITACLGTPTGNLIMVENPEAHLHPAGQSDIGEFLALTAKSGTQVILETHSDHVLNGIRKALKKERLKPNDVAIHFFLPRDEEEKMPQVISPSINQDGDLDQWPTGFFDQFDKDLDFLIGLDTGI